MTRKQPGKPGEQSDVVYVLPTVLSFTVPGEPVAWQRAGVSRTGRHYTRPATRAFEAKVRTMAQHAAERVGWSPTRDDRYAVTLRVYRTHESKGGDVDNYAKAVCDAMNGIAYQDDRYVRRLEVVVERDAKTPRVEVMVEAAA